MAGLVVIPLGQSFVSDGQVGSKPLGAGLSFQNGIKTPTLLRHVAAVSMEGRLRANSFLLFVY